MIKRQVAAGFRAMGDLMGPLVYLRQAKRGYDPDTGLTSDRETRHDFVGAFTEWEKSKSGIIPAGDKRVVVEADGLKFTPEPDGKVEDAAGTVWRVIQVFPTFAGSEPVIYELQVRP